jgi:LuxR family maltose regulon positive regulatory protein
LITACQSILEGVGDTALELLSTPQPLQDETVPTILINDFVTYSQSVVLVLDDYHEIQNPAIHASLLFLLDHLPDNFYIVISTRIDPPWPLSPLPRSSSHQKSVPKIYASTSKKRQNS